MNDVVRSTLVNRTWPVLFTALALIAVFVGLIGWTWALPAWIWIGLVGSVIGWVDIEHHRIPNQLVVAALLGGLLLIVLGIPDGWLGMLISGLAVFVFLLVLALINPTGLGMGDVKFGFVIGVYAGSLSIFSVLIAVFAAFALAGILGLIGLAIRRLQPRSAIPLGPFLMLGLLVAVATWSLGTL